MSEIGGGPRRIGTTLVWLLLLTVLAFLYGPLIPPLLRSLEPSGPSGAGGLANYAALASDERLLRALWTSLSSGLIVALVAPALALVAAQAVRAFRLPRLVTGLALLPLFVPAWRWASLPPWASGCWRSSPRCSRSSRSR
jgi:ABC-type spermidine/putrescine transport system permease subunit II